VTGCRFQPDCYKKGQTACMEIASSSYFGDLKGE